VRRIPENAVFGSGSAHVRNFRNFSQYRSPLPTHLWVCHRDRGNLLSMTGVMVHFRYYKKRSLAWSRPCTDRSKTVKLNRYVCSVQQQIVPNFTHIGRHLGEPRPKKNLFLLTIVHGHAYGIWPSITFENNTIWWIYFAFRKRPLKFFLYVWKGCFIFHDFWQKSSSNSL